MTDAQMRAEARRVSRVTSLSVDDTTLDLFIVDACREFSKITGGYYDEIAGTPLLLFNIPFNSWGFTLTVDAITIEFTSSSELINDDMSSGSTLQAALESWLEDEFGVGAVTVAMSTDGLSIEIEIADTGHTAVSLSAPTTSGVEDAREYIFGTSPTAGVDGSGNPVITGDDIPKNVTYTLTLGSSVLDAMWATWDGKPLSKCTFEALRRLIASTVPHTVSTPTSFAERADEVVLYPTPSEWKSCILGVNRLAVLISEVDTDYHEALSQYAAYRLCKTNDDLEKAGLFYAEFMNGAGAAKRQLANENSAIPFGYSVKSTSYMPFSGEVSL